MDIIQNSAVNTHITYLKKNEYIRKIGKIKLNNIYEITEKGYFLVKEIEKNIKLNNTDSKNNFKEILKTRFVHKI